MFKVSQVIGYVIGIIAIPLLIYVASSMLIKFLILSVGFPRIVGDVIGGFGGLVPAGYMVFKGFRGKNRAEIQDTSQTTMTGIKVKDYVFGIRTAKNFILKITNPFAGILVAGGPGGGKSFSVIEPIITQAVQKGFTGIIYDFKFPTFARVLNAAAKNSKAEKYYVNFDDLNRSHRVNPIHPDIITTMSHATGAADAVMSNLKKGEDNFFSDNATSYLAGIIWFLREEYPTFCTLPHAMRLAAQPVKQVINLICQNEEVATSVASIKTAVDEGAGNQLAGVISTLQNALGKINTRSIVWVLSGNDLTLDLNNPDAPKLLVIGNNPDLRAVYGPVLALIVTTTVRKLNQKGKLNSLVILDEAPTLYIPDFPTLPATGRENGIVTLVGCQDFSQIEEMYGPQQKDAILNTLSNRFYGRMPHEPSAQYVVRIWGKEYVEQRSRSVSQPRLGEISGAKSDSYSLTQRDRVTVQEVTDLKKGEFLGQLVESDVSYFRAQIKPDLIDRQEIAAFKNVSEEEVKANYTKISEDIKALLLDKKIAEPEPRKETMPAQSQSHTPRLSDEF
ncbi:type IV secretory system conjugative DNA transfer family protein [Spirosoma endophyticum]|uniref:Type IV secretory system Conjugative DNA transfer n=1 Tax=Spirosoma endophyticum TaxID=662367 RepID=A0A1I2E564_9BACT|nr:type IV secretory system conjugative DNA transfer family protein [Spirosoma endophyticum]SFE87651.1 Type IV secretory system Conjugative DNA transfer [Spirosoma endophyticum]